MSGRQGDPVVVGDDDDDEDVVFTGTTQTPQKATLKRDDDVYTGTTKSQPQKKTTLLREESLGLGKFSKLSLGEKIRETSYCIIYAHGGGIVDEKLKDNLMKLQMTYDELEKISIVGALNNVCLYASYYYEDFFKISDFCETDFNMQTFIAKINEINRKLVEIVQTLQVSYPKSFVDSKTANPQPKPIVINEEGDTCDSGITSMYPPGPAINLRAGCTNAIAYNPSLASHGSKVMDKMYGKFDYDTDREKFRNIYNTLASYFAKGKKMQYYIKKLMGKKESIPIPKIKRIFPDIKNELVTVVVPSLKEDVFTNIVNIDVLKALCILGRPIVINRNKAVIMIYIPENECRLSSLIYDIPVSWESPHIILDTTCTYIGDYSGELTYPVDRVFGIPGSGMEYRPFGKGGNKKSKRSKKFKRCKKSKRSKRSNNRISRRR